jgi:hypothetical protein
MTEIYNISYIEFVWMIIGTDASEVFEEIGRHTTEARELMKKYCVGRLKS